MSSSDLVRLAIVIWLFVSMGASLLVYAALLLGSRFDEHRRLRQRSRPNNQVERNENMNNRISPGVIWTTIATVVPLVIAFINGLSRSGIIAVSAASGIIVILNALVSLYEIFWKDEEGTSPAVVGNVAVDGAGSAATNQRGSWLRFFFGG